MKYLLSVIFLFMLLPNINVAQEFEMMAGPDNLLTRPWHLQYGPDDHLWITERTVGSVVRVDPETFEKDVLLTISDVYSDAGQDGLLGMALHERFMTDSPFVYLSYTRLIDGTRKQTLVRYTYSITDNDGSLSDPMVLLENIPSSHDHNSGRLIFGPDQKLYYSIGDQGSNQNRNYCDETLSQVMPTQEEIEAQDWTNYPGKILRLNTDGSIPSDNPTIEGVQSHIFSYGHRNPQGLVFGSNESLYSSEHGPDTDDEVNIIQGNNNYGWPVVVGFQDAQAYQYCNWSSVSNCSSLSYSKTNCPTDAATIVETDFNPENLTEPLFSMFNVSNDFDFNNPACESSWICRPNVAPSSIEIYEQTEIPEWTNSLLVTSLKRGRVYRLQLDESGTQVIGDTTQHFNTQNRYRDIAIHPNGKVFYIITDPSGNTSGPLGLSATNNLHNPATILRFELMESVSNRQEPDHVISSIWPNPVTETFQVSLNSTSNPVSGQLINSAGIVVMDMPRVNHQQQFFVGNLNSGLYIFRITTRSHTEVHKLIVE